MPAISKCNAVTGTVLPNIGLSMDIGACHMRMAMKTKTNLSALQAIQVIGIGLYIDIGIEKIRINGSAMHRHAQFIQMHTSR